jgi:hypothetical protein
LEIIPEKTRQQADRTIYAPANFYFATLILHEILFEGRKSIRYFYMLTNVHQSSTSKVVFTGLSGLSGQNLITF